MTSREICLECAVLAWLHPFLQAVKFCSPISAIGICSRMYHLVVQAGLEHDQERSKLIRRLVKLLGHSRPISGSNKVLRNTCFHICVKITNKYWFFETSKNLVWKYKMNVVWLSFIFEAKNNCNASFHQQPQQSPQIMQISMRTSERDMETSFTKIPSQVYFLQILNYLIA